MRPLREEPGLGKGGVSTGAAPRARRGPRAPAGRSRPLRVPLHQSFVVVVVAHLCLNSLLHFHFNHSKHIGNTANFIE